MAVRMERARGPEEKRLDRALGRGNDSQLASAGKCQIAGPGHSARSAKSSDEGSNGLRETALQALGLRRLKKESAGLYNRLLGQADSLTPEVSKAIADDLCLGEIPGQVLGWSAIPISVFQTRAGREPLQKCLQALAASDPAVGYRRELGLVAAGMYAILGNDEDTFIATQEVMRKFSMRGYFLPPYAELEAGITVIWRMMASELPDVASAFDYDDQSDKPCFGGLIRGWLRTLFMSSIGRQPFADFVLLLHNVVCAEDPLEPLHVAFAVLCRLQAAFSAVRSLHALRDLTSRLESELLVDSQLLWHIRGQGRARQWRVTVNHLCKCILPSGEDVREFTDASGIVGSGPTCGFHLVPGSQVWQRHALLWGGEYRVRLTFEGLVWQAPNGRAIHRTPVICGVFECEGPPQGGGVDPWSGCDLNALHGFAITRTSNRATWGISALDGSGKRWANGVAGVDDELKEPDFFIGGLSRKLQFDLRLRLAPNFSHLEFIYNDTILANFKWSTTNPVRFGMCVPMERDARSETFLTRLSHKAVQRLEIGASCKRATVMWVPPAAKHPTFDLMLPRIFISRDAEPNFIYRNSSQTIRGFEFPCIGPGEEVEQEKGVIGAGVFELKVSLRNLVWSQADDAMCPIRSEDRLLSQHDGEDMALFIGMRFVEYFGVYLHKSPQKRDTYQGWLSTDSTKHFEVLGPGGNIDLTLSLRKSRGSEALVSDAELSVIYAGNVITRTKTQVSSLIPASFRVKNGILIRTVQNERNVYGSSCTPKFVWTKVERECEQ